MSGNNNAGGRGRGGVRDGGGVDAIVLGPTLSLLRSAFGVGSTPYTVLGCGAASTPAELRQAYRAAAMRHHPDRLLLRRRCRAGADDDECDDEYDCGDGDGRGVGSSSSRISTLKFQAVSAAYQLLADGDRRSRYDATGEVREEDDNDRGEGDGDGDDNGRGRGAPPRPLRRQGREGRGDGGGRPYWEDFFRSVFGEMAGAGVRHAELARAYRGSEDERVDVLRYYRMFGGDMGRVVECVPYGRDEDAGRWRRDIIDPSAAAAAVTVESTGGDAPLVDTEDENNDDEDDGVKDVAAPRGRFPNSSGARDGDGNDGAGGRVAMSKRDRMDCHAARKRKAKAEKEVEFADVLQSKDCVVAKAGGISDAMIASLEEKYGRLRQLQKRR